MSLTNVSGLVLNIVCLRHPKYDGTSNPVLSCKTCCGIFLSLAKLSGWDRRTQMRFTSKGQHNERDTKK